MATIDDVDRSSVNGKTFTLTASIMIDWFDVEIREFNYSAIRVDLYNFFETSNDIFFPNIRAQVLQSSMNSVIMNLLANCLP